MDRDKPTPDDKAREPQAPCKHPPPRRRPPRPLGDGAAETAKADDERGAVRAAPWPTTGGTSSMSPTGSTTYPAAWPARRLWRCSSRTPRKGYYRNTTNLPLGPGDVVAVEASPGHDIGTVTVTGALAELRMRKAAGRNTPEPKRVFRLAKPSDIEKYEEARAREDDTMIRARKIAESPQAST